jgi:hypothetical protein
VTTIKKINLYPDGNDGSHPTSGNLVLLADGEAFFGGAVYRRNGYPLSEEEPLAPWEQELLAGPSPVPTKPRFKVGDKIVVKTDQWNINYTSVSGPVVGEVTRVSGHDGQHAYQVEHKIDNGVTNLIYTDYKAEPFLKPAPTSRFKTGDRVLLSGTQHVYGGRTGTVTESTFTGERHGFDVNVATDGPEGYAVWFYDSEVDFLPTPPPVTHKYPEGLYKAGRGGSGERVFIRHEAESEQYTITYLDGSSAKEGRKPTVNNGMDDEIVASYTLIAAA